MKNRIKTHTMKTIRPFGLALASLLVLAATTLVAGAREIDLRTFRDLDKIADLIVVAKPVSTKDTAEQLVLPHIAPDIQVVGLSSEFEVSFVLKGDHSLKKLVMHHYRLADANRVMMNAPNLAAFDPKESTRYLLFLQREPDGRYAPIEQVDPAETSMVALRGTGWDKMKFEGFKDWLDAKKWLNERPNWGSAMTPEISPAGRGEGSLHEAALNGKLEKAKALLKTNPGLVFNQDSYASQTPLHLAAEYGHKDVAELLLANKADVEAKAYGGWTPLLNAVFGGRKDLVELLLAHKANVNVKEDAGRTPLHVAAENGRTEIAAFLLAKKADLNAKNRDGYTPLHIAAALGYKDMVMLLLANKADIKVTENLGLTPLHVAARNGSKEAVELLLAARADPNARDNAGQTPLDLATANNHNDIAELLRKKVAQDKNASY
jgi:ankyrin repeat protein